MSVFAVVRPQGYEPAVFESLRAAWHSRDDAHRRSIASEVAKKEIPNLVLVDILVRRAGIGAGRDRVTEMDM
jgi:hypothetical protein